MRANRPTVPLVWGALVAGVVGSPRVGWGAPLENPPIVVEAVPGSCPSTQAVRAEIVRLVPPSELHRVGPPVRIAVDDQGGSYVVSVFDGQTASQRAHDDEGRHCAKRARFAAVFAVLTLMPPEVMLAMDDADDESGKGPAEPTPHAEGAPPPASTSEPSATKGAAPSPQRTRWLGIEAGTRYSWVVSVGNAVDYAVPGLELRTSFPLPRRRWAPIAVMGGDGPGRFRIQEQGIEGSVQRGDLALGVRLQRPRHRFVPRIDGLMLGRLARWRGSGLLENRSSYELSPAFGVNAGLELRWGRVVLPFLEVRSFVFPFPAELTSQPGGSAGRTSVVELGLAVGGGWLP